MSHWGRSGEKEPGGEFHARAGWDKSLGTEVIK